MPNLKFCFFSVAAPAVLGLTGSAGALADVGFAAGSGALVRGPDAAVLYGFI